MLENYEKKFSLGRRPSCKAIVMSSETNVRIPQLKGEDRLHKFSMMHQYP